MFYIGGKKCDVIVICFRRERQEQLMGYRKRGPKPKHLLLPVNIFITDTIFFVESVPLFLNLPVSVHPVRGPKRKGPVRCFGAAIIIVMVIYRFLMK